MKRRWVVRLIIFVLVIVIVLGVALGTYFLLNKTREASTSPDIVSGTTTTPHPYFVHELRNGHYRLPDPVTGSIAGRPMLGLPDQSHTHCFFQDNFKAFKIRWMGDRKSPDDDPVHEFVFIVTSFSQSRGHITANVRHIYNGRVLTYKITSTNKRIIMRATATYTVTVATEEYTQVRPQTIVRANSIVMTFWRATPRYITEGFMP